MGQYSDVAAIDVKSMVCDELRRKILELRDNIAKNYLAMGKLLIEVHDNRYYVRWGYNTFMEYSRKELGFKSRKSYYLMDIYRFLEKHKLFDTYKGDLIKIYDLSILERRGVVTKDNFDQWLNKALTLSRDKLRVEGKLQAHSTQDHIRIHGYMLKEDYEFFRNLMENRFQKEFDADNIGRAISFLSLFYSAMNFNGTVEELSELIRKLERQYKDKGVRIFFVNPEGDLSKMYDILMDMSAEMAKIALEYLPYKKKDERASHMMKVNIKSSIARSAKTRNTVKELRKKLNKYKDFMPWKL